MTDDTTTDNATGNTEAASAEAAEAHEAVGKLLRDAREAKGEDVAEVARVLRISQKYLEALEDGRNADLPGTTYAIGFVRSYAEHLNLDGEEIVRRYKAEAEGLSGKTDLIFPKPIPDGGVPGAAVLGLGVIVAAVAYGVWYWNSNKVDVEVARVEPVPEHMAAPKAEEPKVETPEVAAPVAEASEAASEPAPEGTAQVEAVVEAAAEPEKVEGAVADAVEQAADTPVETPAEVPAEAAVEEAVAEAATDSAPKAVEDAVEEVAAVAEDAAPEAVVSGPVVSEPVVSQPVAAEVEGDGGASTPAEPVTEGPSRITVRAKSNSWIQVRDVAADRLLFTRLLRAGDEYEVPNRSGLRLMTGNAGALELLVDGEAVPAIGEIGEVRRDVELDPDSLKSGNSASTSPAPTSED